MPIGMERNEKKEVKKMIFNKTHAYKYIMKTVGNLT